MTDRALHDDTTPRTRIGDRYTLLGEVGRGGMASVHRAHDEVLDRVVAVKLLHPHLAGDPAFLERFRREARAAAALSHPNVVGVHDWGETQDGAYLILQLVDGVSLREVLHDRGSLEPAEALALLGPAAAGLGAAHAAGLVHRDVKPENLLIDRDGTVRVTDFGLARAAASATATFGADVLVGSPHYLSPEAVDGMQLDARADVYALGIVLFECLVGAPPHEGETPFATALRHTSTPVPPPSALRPELGAEVDEVVLLACSIDREERLPDAAAFGRMLRAAVPGSASLPHPAALLPSTEGTDGSDAGSGSTRVIGRSAERTGLTPTEARHDTSEAVGHATDVTHVVGATRNGRRRQDGQQHAGDGPARHRVAVAPTRRRRGWVVLLVLLALLGGSAAAGYVVWDRVLAPVTDIPGVLGAAETAAVGQLADAGFEVEVDGDREHDLVIPEGHVLDQDPEDAARRGSTVTLVLSAGPTPVEIPTVEGLDLDEAEAELAGDGLGATTTEEYDEEVPRGTVVTSDPSAGTVVDEGSDVTLVISLGPAPIDVPALIGDTEGAARQRLEDVDLELVVDGRPYDGAAAGTILRQDPVPGGTLHRGETVTVTVSAGPRQVAVPSVRGKLVDEAVAELEALGFEVEVEREGGLTALFRPDRVYDQDPAPDSSRDEGSTVVVYAYEA